MHCTKNQFSIVKIVMSLEEKLDLKIRTNPTPREERNYPIKVGKKY
jgi:hypothetical protein